MARRFIDKSRALPPRPFVSRFFLFIAALAAILTVMVMLAPKPAHAACSVYAMMALAQEHSNNMARRDHLDHDGFAWRAARGARAENVAYGYATEVKTIAQWWRSPGHAANMRLPGCRAIASAVSRSGKHYWTLEVGQ